LSQSVSEKARAVLREIGLTEYESRAYLSLLQTGGTTASQVSENTEVPYSKIYEVLNLLEKKGWIETRSGRPKLYYPKSPVEALEAARLRLEDRMEGWEKPVLEELQPLYDRREIREKPDVWILRGEFDAIAKLRDLVGNAESELMIAMPVLTESVVSAILPLLRSLVESKIKPFIMVSRNQGFDVDALSETGEVRLRDNMFGGGVIADGREAILILGEKKPSLIIWSDHLGLVRFAKGYFQHLWDTAEKV